MLPFTSPREALLACPPSPPWNLSSFTVESTLFFPCSRSDLFSFIKVQLSLTLTLSHLMIWYSGLMALFVFFLAKAALAHLPTALSLSVAPKPLFPFQQAQYAQVFLLKPAPLCMLFAGLGSTNKLATFLLFSHLTLVLSSPPYPLLIFRFTSNSLADLEGTVLSFSSCSIRLQWVPRYWFLSGNNAADELARRSTLLVPCTIPCSLFFFISRIHLYFFSTGGVVSHCNSLTHRVLQSPPRNLYSYDCYMLSRLRCNRHSLLLSCNLSRIGRIENPSCSAYGHSSLDISHLILYCPAMDSLVTLCLSTTSGPGPGELLSFCGSMVFCHAPIPRMGLGNKQQHCLLFAKTQIM